MNERIRSRSILRAYGVDGMHAIAGRQRRERAGCFAMDVASLGAYYTHTYRTETYILIYLDPILHGDRAIATRHDRGDCNGQVGM